MNFNLLNIKNICFKESFQKSIEINYKNSKNEIKDFIIKSPVLYLPFGIEKEYDNYILKFQLKKTDNEDHNKNIESFLKFIQDIETLIEKKFNMPIKSQLRYSDKFDPILITKVLHRRNYILTNVTENNSNYNFFKIKEKTFMKVKILIDKLWINKEDNYIVYKFKLKNIYLSV